MSNDRAVITVRIGVGVSATDADMLSERIRSQVQELCNGLALPAMPVIILDPRAPWLSIEDRVIYEEAPFGQGRADEPALLADAAAWSVLEARANLVTDEVAQFLAPAYTGKDSLRPRLADLLRWGFGAHRLPGLAERGSGTETLPPAPSANDANPIEIHVSDSSREDKGQPNWATEVQSQAFTDLGLVIPPPRIIASSSTSADQIRLHVNDLVCPALCAVEPTHIIVLANPRECLLADPQVRPWRAWTLGGPYSIIRSDRAQFLPPTLTAVPAARAAAALVVRHWCSYLPSRDGIALQLAVLSRQMPDLARASALIPGDRLVEIARHLLTMGESIYDLRNILQTLLILGDRTPFDPSCETVVCPPAHLPRLAMQPKSSTAEGADSVAQDAGAVFAWFHDYVVCR